MISFTATMQKFEKQGEKTGWTYIEIPVDIAQELKPGNKKEFKVKGKIDSHTIKRVSLMPMGAGRFIMPVNSSMRKAIGKRHGAMVKLQLTEDKSEFVFNKDFLECLADEPVAEKFFKTLPGSHQRYFSKWIDEAKTEQTKIKRIALAVNALSKESDYGKMLREAKKDKEELEG
jgi:hypothetical protein